MSKLPRNATTAKDDFLSAQLAERQAAEAAQRDPTAFEIVWRNVWVRAAVQLIVILLLLWLLVAQRHTYLFALQTALVGFVIAYILNPVVSGMQRARISRGFATVLVYIAVILLLVLGTYLLTQVVSELTRFVNLVPKALNSLDPLFGKVSGWFAGMIERLPGFLSDRIGSDPGNANIAQEVERRIMALIYEAADATVRILENILNQGPGILISSAGNVVAATFQVFLVLVASAYFLNDFPKIVANFKRYIPLRYRAIYEDVGEKADRAIGGYLRGQIVIAVILGFVIYLGLTLIGVHLALAISFLAAVFNLVPYLGPIIGAIPAVLLALTTDTPWTSALFVVLLFVVANQLEGNFLSPFILSKSTNLHPVTVLIAITFGFGAFGLVGALFAVPFVALTKLIIETYILTRPAFTGAPKQPHIWIQEALQDSKRKQFADHENPRTET